MITTYQFLCVLLMHPKLLIELTMESYFFKMRQIWVSEHIVRIQSMQMKWDNKVSVRFWG